MPQRGGTGASWFQRFVLPGLAFKAVVIGGGYATGRNWRSSFWRTARGAGWPGYWWRDPVWSLVCAATSLAVATGAYDYRRFFMTLLGAGRLSVQIAYSLFIILILSGDYGAAAGAIGQALFGWLPLVGTMLLAVGITVFATFGNAAVEGLFKWVSILLYCVYAAFLILVLSRFGGAIATHFGRPLLSGNWLVGGIAYASYNVVAAVVILPALRHLTAPRDAIWAGLVARAALAMIPAMAFFIGMTSFYPKIASAPLPSEMVFRQFELPLFHLVFELMISALLKAAPVQFTRSTSGSLACGGCDIEPTCPCLIVSSVRVPSCWSASFSLTG